MSLWYALPAVMLAYSAAQWVRRAEPRAKTISRSLWWLAFAAYCVSANALTTTLMVLMLLQWVGLQVYVANRGNKEPQRSHPSHEKVEHPDVPVGESRMTESRERDKERRRANDGMHEENVVHVGMDDSDEDYDEDQLEKEREQLDVSAREGWFDVRFRIPNRESFPLSEGGEISIEANDYTGEWKVEEVEFDEAGEGGSATCSSELKFRGSDGREWKVKSHFLLDSVLDLERFDREGEKLAGKWWRDADEKTTAAMRDRCVIAGLVLSNDCRVRFPLVIGGKKHCIMLKYLSWRVDAALSESRDSVIVRVRELYEEVFDRDILDETDSTEPEFQDMRMMKPFFYELPVEDFLPLFRKDAHFADRDALNGWDGASPIPRPTLHEC